MTKKSYAMHVSMIVGTTVILLLFIFILVGHHRGMPDRARMDRGALLSSATSVAERIKPVGQVSVLAAQTKPEPVKNTVAPPPSRDGQQVYQASCVACHGGGIAGAPKVNDKGQWAKRIAKGVDTLYASAVNGVQGSAGVMPAKGGNPALSNAEVKAAVDFMVARSK
ncbi:MAG: c-type cytochrome [Proteobacteria bacterium]|nr:c-type cytochrome [Pseudomonadota bacterium]